jgi:hypothetical protein
VPSRSERKHGNHFKDISLSEIKLLSLPSRHSKTVHTLERVDAVLRDMSLDESPAVDMPQMDFVKKTHHPESHVLPVLQKENHNEEENVEHNKTPPQVKITHRFRYSTTIQYNGDPDVMLGAIENYIKINGVRTLNTSIEANSSEYHHTKELIQADKLFQLSTWRKSLMQEVERKIGGKQ